MLATSVRKATEGGEKCQAKDYNPPFPLLSLKLHCSLHYRVSVEMQIPRPDSRLSPPSLKVYHMFDSTCVTILHLDMGSNYSEKGNK